MKTMGWFEYKDEIMHAESVSLLRIAEEVGTPCYCYSSKALETNYKAFDEAFRNLNPLIAYSIKANSNQAVIATLAECGAGADVVSKGELRRALSAGIPGNRIVFSGVGKTDEELLEGLKSNVYQFNLESRAQLEKLSAIANKHARMANVAFRINPDVDAKTHDKIATGRKADKFGVPMSEARALYTLAASLPGIEVKGVDLHIGSQLTTLEPYRQAFTRLSELITTLRDDGHSIRQVDLGGGLGVCYKDEIPPTPLDYSKLVREILGGLDCRLILEPGRSLVADAGVLLSRVIEVKYTEGQQFVVIDAAMNDILRPALYGAWHPIHPVCKPAPNAARDTVDIVGPICESGDVMGRSRPMSYLSPGDIISVGVAGAYGAVMSSNYNTRPPAAEIMVRGNEIAIVRPRIHVDTLIAQDSLPMWLKGQQSVFKGKGAA